VMGSCCKKNSDSFLFTRVWFSAAFRRCIWLARLRLTCCAPRLELQGLQAGTMPSAQLPPLSTSYRWSAVVAGAFLHQWHTGLPSSSWRLALRYSGVSYSLSLMVSPTALGCACGWFHGTHQVCGRCPSRRLWVVSTGRRLNPCRAVTVVFVSFIRCSRLRAVSGKPRLPTFPCKHQQSANPYVAVVVFNCVGCYTAS
jgi:hypothetical protein